MNLVFGNPAGFWALLGVPVILAIHFLQQRARVLRTSTWFLIEKLAPDSARGRTWDRLRTSRALWLQLLTVLLATWLIAQPRWLRAESAQTVVMVLDASASMDAFREPAIGAAEREMILAEGLAARTTWIVMTTDSRQPPLYRGGVRDEARLALQAWQPELGQHDFQPALRLARTLTGAAGRTLLVTDARTKVPPDQRSVGVGRPLANVGFAGATVTRESEGYRWRALIKNHATAAVQRTWHVETSSGNSNGQPLDLAAGAITEVSALFPEGIDRVTVVLEDDAFALDNRLPLLRPRPKRMSVAVDGTDAAADFFRRVALAIDGTSTAPTAIQADLRLGRLRAEEVASEPRGGVFWPPADERAQVPLLREPVTPERDPLVAGLNWQGWLGAGPLGYAAGPGDRVLLWHGQWPLVFLRAIEPVPGTAAAEQGRTVRKLMLGFDWDTSNAGRLPAMVLLTRRFLEAERNERRDSYAANFDCASLVPLRGVPADGNFTVAFEDTRPGRPASTRALTAAERGDLRAPGRPGFFTVRRESEELVYGAAQFADARQGDFRIADSFMVEVRNERAATLERNTVADPLAAAWLLLMVAAMLGSWWTRTSPANAGETPVSPARPARQAELVPSRSDAT